MSNKCIKYCVNILNKWFLFYGTDWNTDGTTKIVIYLKNIDWKEKQKSITVTLHSLNGKFSSGMVCGGATVAQW